MTDSEKQEIINDLEAEEGLIVSEYDLMSLKGIAPLDRVISLTGPIGSESYQHVLSSLHAMNTSHGPIKLLLNSPGGEVAQGFAIYELIKNSPSPVDIYGMGQVMSIAAIILQAGAKRYLSPLARFMIHNGSVSYDKPVDIDKFKSQIKDIQMDAEIYYDLLEKRSNLSRKRIKQMCYAEKYLTAQQCLEMGLIDGVKLYTED